MSHLRGCFDGKCMGYRIIELSVHGLQLYELLDGPVNNQLPIGYNFMDKPIKASCSARSREYESYESVKERPMNP